MCYAEGSDSSAYFFPVEGHPVTPAPHAQKQKCGIELHTQTQSEDKSEIP